MVVAVDWDGTLVGGDGRWLPGAVDALVRLVRGGDKVLIHSCRAGWTAGADEIRSRLADVGLVGRVELAIGGKPAADAYVDDKAVRFTGDWPDTLWQLRHAA